MPNAYESEAGAGEPSGEAPPGGCGRGSGGREHAAQIHRLSRGLPRILEELLIELATRDYRMDKPFGIDLLDLDRRIQRLTDPYHA